MLDPLSPGPLHLSFGEQGTAPCPLILMPAHAQGQAAPSEGAALSLLQRDPPPTVSPSLARFFPELGKQGPFCF